MSYGTRNIVSFSRSASLAAAIIVCACATPPAAVEKLNTPKENSVQLFNYQHEVHFLPNSATPAPGEDDSLAAFLARMSPQPGDQMAVQYSGVPDSLTNARVQQVAAELRRRFPNTDIGTGPGDTDAGAVAVSIGRYMASAPKCPDWANIDPEGFSNAPSPDFGCATTGNLGAMVANPADLLHGATPGAADAEFAGRSVQRYRSGELFKALEPAGSMTSTGAQSSNGNTPGGTGTGSTQ